MSDVQGFYLFLSVMWIAIMAPICISEANDLVVNYAHAAKECP